MHRLKFVSLRLIRIYLVSDSSVRGKTLSQPPLFTPNKQSATYGLLYSRRHVLLLDAVFHP